MLEVAECIVHPAHHPLLAKAQPAGEGRAGNARPGGRFLGDGDGVRKFFINRFIELLEKGDGFCVFVAAELIGNPLALLAGVVQIKHGGHGVDAQAVDVIVFQPEKGVGDEERTHLIAAIVENAALPVGVETLAGVGVVVEVGPVEVGQPVGIGWKVGGYPVEEDADTGLMESIHQVHKVLWRAEAAGRCKVAGDLIPPRREVGVLHHGQELHMGEAHLLDIADHLVGHFSIAEAAGASMNFLPGTDVYLVYRVRLVEPRDILAVVHPVLILPLVLQVPDDRGGIGRNFPEQCKGVAFLKVAAILGVNMVLVQFSPADARDEAFPNPRTVPTGRKRMAVPVPVIEIPYDGNGLCIGRPNGEIDAPLAVHFDDVATQFFVEFEVLPGAEQAGVEIGQ